MVYTYDMDNPNTTKKEYDLAREIEVNVARAFIRYLERDKPFYLKMIPIYIKRWLDGGNAYIDGCHILQIVWIHVSASEWILSEDCSDWTGMLWRRAMWRVHNKFEKGSLNVIFEDAEYGELTS